MRVYTIHVRHGGLDPERDLVPIKEGFSWPAFWLTVPWALWHRMWLAALVLIAVGVGIEAAAAAIGLDSRSLGVVAFGLAVAAGFVGNDLRRAALLKRGFVSAGLAIGTDPDEALHRFLQSRPDLAREVALAAGAVKASA